MHKLGPKLKSKLGVLKPFETRNWLERSYVLSTLGRPFSGYLGGHHAGGYWVQRLADEWQSTFGVRHAVPCNSATSGLMAACMAVGIGPGDRVWCPATTMSATASCAKILGANVEFIDIEPVTFSMDLKQIGGSKGKPKAVIVTNLFGHPAYLQEIKLWCLVNKVWMIEDNAQSPFAKVGEHYAGTVGHLGVFSLNIHKHLQTGEGGIVVSNDDDLALKVRDAVNHGELRPGIMGLNLRMTEPIAALASAQLSKGPGIIEGRRELALELTDMVKDYLQIHPPVERDGCRHVYYIWAAKIWHWDRRQFVARINSFGFPLREGYAPPLHRVFNMPDVHPIAETLEYCDLMTFEVCSYSPNRKQRKIMRQIFKEVGDSLQ
jgi:dTDP-4-amino-4,6-dideoxygalactose transaminase